MIIKCAGGGNVKISKKILITAVTGAALAVSFAYAAANADNAGL